MAELPLVSVEVLAAACHLEPRRCQQLAKQGVMVKAVHGQYDLLKSLSGYIKYLQAQTGGGNRDAHTEKTRLLSAQSDKVEIEVATLRRERIPADIVHTLMLKAAQQVRTNLMAIPSRCAPLLPGNPIENEQIIRGQIDEILKPLSEAEIVADIG